VYLGKGQDSNISVAGLIHGNGTLLKEQIWAALFVICFSAIGTFVLLKLVGLVVPLRMSEPDMEEGDLAVHGHEVYPSDVPSLGFPSGLQGWPAPSGAPAESPG
jgi:Amt family ammonium transporter